MAHAGPERSACQVEILVRFTEIILWIKSQVPGQLEHENDVEIGRGFLQGVQVTDGTDQEVGEHGVLFLFLQHPVQYFGNKDSLGALGNVIGNGIERGRAADFPDHLDLPAFFVIYFEIEDEKGLKEI